MTQTAAAGADAAWALVEREKRRDRTLRRVSVVAWSVTFVVVLVLALVVGLQVSQLLQAYGVGGLRAEFGEQIARVDPREPRRYETVFVMPDGRRIDVEATESAVVLEEGPAFLCVARDIGPQRIGHLDGLAHQGVVVEIVVVKVRHRRDGQPVEPLPAGRQRADDPLDDRAAPLDERAVAEQPGPGATDAEPEEMPPLEPLGSLHQGLRFAGVFAPALKSG